MINTAINHISKHLNLFLKRSFELNEDIAVVSNIVEQDGSLAANVDNKIIVSLVNIERDTTPGYHLQKGTSNTDKSIQTFPPVHLNLYLMFTAHFSGNNYSESLKFLSNTISFFQRNSVFNHQNTPDLDKQIQKLTLEIENLDIKDLSSLWTIISSKYLPSILYKVRMVTFDSQHIKAQVPSLTSPKPFLKH